MYMSAILKGEVHLTICTFLFSPMENQYNDLSLPEILASNAFPNSMKSLFKVYKRARSKWSCTKKHMARKMLAETNKQQAGTTRAFKSSCQPPTKLHAEVFDIKQTLPPCYVTYRYSKMEVLFFVFSPTLDKDFIWFGSTLEAEINYQHLTNHY